MPSVLPVLQGNLIALRPFEERDVNLVCSVASDPLIPLITTVSSRGTRADALAFIARQHDRLAEGAGYSFAIADARTDEAVGHIGLWTTEISQGRANTGYWVAPNFRRRGYVREALQVLTAWACTLEEVRRLQLFVEPWNEGSWRAAQACGYHREGLLRKWEQVGNDRKDMYVYSIVAGM